MKILERLASVVTNNFGLKAVSFGIALLLWFIVLGSKGEEAIKDVPVVYVTGDENAISNEVPERVAFRIAGPKAFLRTVLDRTESPIRVDLSSQPAGTVNYRFFSDNIRLPLGVKALATTPSGAVIRLEKKVSKLLPVKVNFRGNLSEGYTLKRFTIMPDEVTVRGSKTKIASLKEVPSLPIDLEGHREPFSTTLEWDLDQTRIQVDGTPPNVKLDIRPATPNYRAKNIPIQIRGKKVSKVMPNKVLLLLRAPDERISSLGHSDLRAYIDTSLSQKGRQSIRVEVELPKDIGLVQIVPDTVEVWVE